MFRAGWTPGAFGPIGDELDGVEELFPPGPQLRHALFGRPVFQFHRPGLALTATAVEPEQKGANQAMSIACTAPDADLLRAVLAADYEDGTTAN